jgi:hypothetical protein
MNKLDQLHATHLRETHPEPIIIVPTSPSGHTFTVLSPTAQDNIPRRELGDVVAYYSCCGAEVVVCQIPTLPSDIESDGIG